MEENNSENIPKKIKSLSLEEINSIAPIWVKDFYLSDLDNTEEFNAATCKDLGKSFWTNIMARYIQGFCPDASILGLMKYQVGAAEGLGSEFAMAMETLSKITNTDYKNEYIPTVGGILYNHEHKMRPMIYFSNQGETKQNNVYKFGSFEDYDKIAGKPPFNPKGCYIVTIFEEIVKQLDKRIPAGEEALKLWQQDFSVREDGIDNTVARYARQHGHGTWKFVNYNEWDNRHNKSQEIEKMHPFAEFEEKIIKRLKNATDEDLQNPKLWYEVKERVNLITGKKKKYLRATVFANEQLDLKTRQGLRLEILEAIEEDDPRGILTARIGKPRHKAGENISQTFGEINLSNINPNRPDKEKFPVVEQTGLSVGADLDNTVDLELAPVSVWKCWYKGKWINRIHIEPIITIPLKKIPREHKQTFKHQVLLDTLPDLSKTDMFTNKEGFLNLAIDDNADVYWPIIHNQLKLEKGMNNTRVCKATKHNRQNSKRRWLSWGNDTFDEWMRINLESGFISIDPSNTTLLKEMSDMTDKPRAKKSDIRKHDDTSSVNKLNKYDALKYAIYCLRLLYNGYEDYREDFYELENQDNKLKKEQQDEKDI